MKMVLLLLFVISNLIGNEITNYKAVNFCIDLQGKEYYAFRSLIFNKQKAFLIVDTQNLNTILISQKVAVKKNCNKNSRYFKLIAYEKNKKHPLQNDGITSSKNGIVITTDLCPSSKKSFERRLYETLIHNFKNPVPVTVFITKRWIEKHQRSFKQLKRWQKEKKLNITWGNHTAKHIYHPHKPLKSNFVLSPEENLNKDVLDLEISLLKRGVLPSIFFRFPGLVSNKETLKKVANLGLIIIGSNSWLAKGDKLNKHSIILVHGNKNEPKGVDILLKLIKEKKIVSLSDIKNL